MPQAQYTQPAPVQHAQYASQPQQINHYNFPRDAGPINIGATTGHHPVSVTCPQCNYNGQTKTKYVPT
eukprot:3423821-Pyramimonas_sp.AAC.1